MFVWLRCPVFLVPLVCVACGGLDGDDSAGGSTGSTATTTGTSSTTTGTGTTTTTTTTQTFPVGTPRFQVSTDAGPWDGEAGYYLAGASQSFVNATFEVSAQVVQRWDLTVEGDLHFAGTYPVSTLQHTEQVASSGATFQYVVSQPGGIDGLNLVVQGFADDFYLFAELVGVVTLDDAVGAGTLVVDGITIESWERFGN